MRKSICFALLFALVGAVPSAQALIISGTDTPASTISVSGTFTGIPAGTMLDIYEITADSEDSLLDVTAFELTFSGSFAQVQNASFGTNEPSPLLADVGGFPADALLEDTHLLPDLTLPGGAEPPPTEGVITLGSPGSGFADDLISHKVAIAGTDQAPVVTIAQIVMLHGDTGSFTGQIAVESFSDPFDVGGPIGVTDPNATNTPPSVDFVMGDPNAPIPYDQKTLATFLTPANYQMQGTDAEDGDDDNLDWTLDSFTGPFGAAGTMLPGSGNGNQMLSSTGLFTWDPTGSAKGFYYAGVTVMDSGGLTGTGVLQVQVPEPAAFVLAGLSLIGIVSSRRRIC